MADFIQTSNTKTAVRELAAPIADVATFVAAPGQQNEGEIEVLSTHCLEQGNAVHHRHVVIGDDGIVGRFGQYLKGFLCRVTGIAFNIGVIFFKKCFGQGRKMGSSSTIRRRIIHAPLR
ncbi:MAG: hypothetical protein QCH35_03670 [Methanomicrobiaceae archaeon]|nr:hypothetical protein [Methanomicrobiaceae archaeon]